MGRIGKTGALSPRGVVLACTLAIVLTAGACTPQFRNHGYAPLPEDLDNITVGVDTRGTVEEQIGRPSSSGVLSDSGYYYVSQRIRTFAYQEPQVIDRQVVAISFDGDGVVSNVERFGLEDGNVVALERRVTDSSVQGLTFLRQLMGNVGRIDAIGGLGGGGSSGAAP